MASQFIPTHCTIGDHTSGLALSDLGDEGSMILSQLEPERIAKGLSLWSVKAYKSKFESERVTTYS